MNKPSTLISLDAASAGMELACDLVDARGTVLLQQGSVLTGSMLAALERRGIVQLQVLGSPGEEGGNAAEAAEAARRQAAQERLGYLFRRAQCPAAAQLLASLQAYRMERPR